MSTTTDVRELIDQAKSELISKPKATKANSKAIEASDPQLINELLAKRLLIVEQAKELAAQKAEIENVIRDIIDNKDELLVHGAKVASISRWREVRVLTDVVKETFSVAEYPELFKSESKSRLTIH